MVAKIRQLPEENAAIHRLAERKQFKHIDLLERMEMLGRQLERTSQQQERQNKKLMKVNRKQRSSAQEKSRKKAGVMLEEARTKPKRFLCIA
jgi:hypothetical protein